MFAEPGNIAKKSLTELCFDLSSRGISISKQGLNERFNEHSVEFLKMIFLTLFEMQLELSMDKNKIKSTHYFNTVRILDGTSIKLAQKLGVFYRGTTGAGVKCQFEFDLLTGVMHYLELQDGKSADSPSGMKRLDSLLENDLILQDTGYFNRETFKKIDEAKAYYVSRAPADTSFHLDSSNPRYHKDGRIMEKYAYEQLCLEDELQTIGRGEVREYQKVYFGSGKKQPTRLVIYRMSEEQEKRQLDRLRRRQQVTSGKIQKKTYDVASISIYITNLPEEVPAKEIPELYRYRWQIELVFKSWKSDMMVDFYRSMKKERWECHFYVEVILLLLSLLITYQLKAYFREEKTSL